MQLEFSHHTVSSVLAIHQEVLLKHGGSAGTRDMALLESAIAATQATFFGEPLMKDGIEIGAAYLFYLCKNHPFIDGNKRTALASCLVFLKLNQLLDTTILDVDDWESLVLDVAASRLDREETTKRLRKLVPVQGMKQKKPAKPKSGAKAGKKTKSRYSNT